LSLLQAKRKEPDFELNALVGLRSPQKLEGDEVQGGDWRTAPK